MKNLHNTLWKIEKEHGSPNIRWQTDQAGILNLGEYHRSNYNPFTNTINFAVEDITGDFFETFIKEVTHAKQFNEEPILSYVKATVDNAKTLFTSITSGKEFNEEYFKLYKEKGTLEYEAHSVLEEPLSEEAWKAASEDIEIEFEKGGK